MLLFIAVNCEWNDWIHGTCSKSCGGGTRYNTRNERVSEAHGGKPCEGDATIAEPCEIQKCPGYTLFLTTLLQAICSLHKRLFIFVILL